VRTFKSIYRLDFPPLFRLLDSFGEHLEFVRERASQPPFENDKTQILLSTDNSNVGARLHVGKDAAAIGLSLKHFDLVVEYEEGVELGHASDHPAVELATHLIKSLAEERIRGIERVGMRHAILVEHEKFQFDALRDHFAKSVTPVNAAVASVFPRLEDFSTTFEACAEDGTHLRAMVGPYRQEERERRFPLGAKGITQALIIDLDLWQTKIEMPGFSLATSARNYERMARKVVEKLVETLLGDLP
jgi:hypothetical protein